MAIPYSFRFLCVRAIHKQYALLSLARDRHKSGIREPPVAPMADADVPGSRPAVQNRREAVNAEQQTRPPGTAIEQPADGVVARPEQRIDAALFFPGRQPAVARDGHA